MLRGSDYYKFKGKRMYDNSPDLVAGAREQRGV